MSYVVRGFLSLLVLVLTVTISSIVAAQALEQRPIPALDVIVNSTADLDPGHFCIPASFDGVRVEQDVVVVS
jgi:hypothetical protein